MVCGIMFTVLTKGVWHHFSKWFDYSVEIRVQSPSFTADLKRLERFAHGSKDAFDVAYQCFIERYGWDDPELVRVQTLASFLQGD